MTDIAVPFLVPQVNVNDDSVILVRWTVPQHARVAAGDVVCEVETTKATSEVSIASAGILEQAADPGARVRVGDTIGIVGPNREAIAAWKAAAQPAAAPDAGELKATPKARSLAAQHGVSLEAIAERVRGTIKETDVRRFLDERVVGAPPAIAPYVEDAGPLAAFDAAVAISLRHAVQHQILTSIDVDCPLAVANAEIQKWQAKGRMVSVLHLIVAAAGKALPNFARLMSVAVDGHVFRYRAVDVAFVARSPNGHLYTPVVRGADRASVETIASAAQAATMAVMRQTLKQDDLQGACLTVSHVAVPGTARVVALPNYGQSAVLGVSAERTVVAVRDGQPIATPTCTLTLTYDHTLCDGHYAASFLAAIVAHLGVAAS